MGKIDWLSALEPRLAVKNLHYEFHGDWHIDPWGWPELEYMLGAGKGILVDYLDGEHTNRSALIDVPKENWGTRPAVVLNIVDRLAFQALVDRLSIDLIGELSPNVFGWRLPAARPRRGVYSHNNKQWDNYRDQLSTLAALYQVALRTDVVSFFASISLETVQTEVCARAPSGRVTSRLLAFLEGFDTTSYRSGLPQRSTASAVIANMVLTPLDDVLEHYARPIPQSLKSELRYHSFARWMDDIWLFLDDAGRVRRAQIELQQTSLMAGLSLNAAKTELLEGADVADEALQIEHSAIDDALVNRNDHAPLEELIDKIIDARETANRTSIKFAAVRMRDNGSRYRVQDLVQLARRMPHGADAWAPLFKSVFTRGSLEEWFLDYAGSDWAGFEWAVAQYGRMFGSGLTPRQETLNYFEQRVADSRTSLPLLALAAQRLSAWQPSATRAVIRAAMKTTDNPHSRRALALAALNANEPRSVVKKWLAENDENRATLEMLETRNYRAQKVQDNYAELK